MHKTITKLLFLFCVTISAQNSTILERLSAINNVSATFYNVDGYSITSQTFNYPFTEKSLKKVYRKYAIKKKKVKTPDDSLSYKNYYTVNSKQLTPKNIQNNAYYFIENKDKRITVIQFSSINKKSKNFERQLVKLIAEGAIPKENFSPIKIDSINFAGRKIKLGGNCNWTNVNTVQCPYNGEMNWSVHKDLQDAKNTVDQQFEITMSRKNGKVVSEEQVNIEFEGTLTTAKKVIYDFTGVTSLLAGLSGGKTLTIYYVAAKVRGTYVSCVLSFWNNDNITESGLAPLLNEVMTLKE